MRRTINQQGFASIIISIVIIAILSLMAVSFALLMRREQRQALDRQLNTQAFYAAESGVNDAVNAIKNNNFTNDIQSCDQTDSISPQGPGSASNLLDETTGVGYTCVLIDQSPGTLEYSGLNTNESKIIKLQASNGQTISKLKISWQDSDYNGSNNYHTALAPDNSNYFLPQKQYLDENPTLFPAGGGSVLRATLMPAPANTSRGDLINRAQTMILFPRVNPVPGSAVGSVSYSPGATDDKNGGFVNGFCYAGNSPKQCNAEITGINGASMYYLRLKAIYNYADVTVTAYNSSDQPIDLVGEQALIDSTGKANDVLRRIQVRVPLNTSYYYPEFAVDSADTLCKRFGVYPSNNSGSGAEIIGLPTALDYDGSHSDPPECALN